jgi:hypothetical protein
VPDEIPREVRRAFDEVTALRRRREDLLRARPAAGHLDLSEITRIDRDIAGVLDRFRDRVDPCDASADVPLILLPVRLETRYARTGRGGSRHVLRVRIYPDEIHVDDLVRGLDDAELEAGRAYWTAVWVDPVPDDAFAVLVGSVGPHRAEYVAYACTPTNLGERGHGVPTFPTPAARGTRNVVARSLPDRFVVIVEQAGTRAQAVGAPVPPDLPMAPIPLEGDTPVDGEGVLRLAEGSQWLTDFAAALTVGMAVEVPLPSGEAPIDRVVAVGTRSSGDPGEGADELEELLVGHRFSGGLSLLAQGTPTNNSDAARSPYRPRRDPVAPLLAPVSVDGSAETPTDATAAARVLGVDAAVLTALVGPGSGEQAVAEAANTALWAPGWGFFLDVLDDGDVLGIDDRQRESARRLFRDHVRGAGVAPALQVRAQPYGVLPASDLSRWKPAGGEISGGVLTVVRALMNRWLRVVDDVVDRLRPDTPDLDETLLAVLGASPTMHGLRVRPVITDDVLDTAAPALGIDPQTLAAERMIRAAVFAETVGASLTGLRFASLDEQDRPLPLPLATERDPEFVAALLETPSRVLAVDSVLQALLFLAWRSSDLDAVRASPATVLPDLLELAGLDASVSVATAGLVSRVEDAEPREFLELADTVARQADVTAGGAGLLRRLTPIRAVDTSLAEVALAAPEGAAATRLAGVAVAGWLRAMGYRAEVRAAMTALASASTDLRAQSVAATLDCSSHRLDAWATAVVAERAGRMRGRSPGGRGLTLGAWGVVEDLAPASGDLPEGWLHAPSTRHAVAAGILHNAHLAHVGVDGDGGPDAPFALDLSSVRLDAATQVLDGLRSGQSLAALIGYRIERGLAEGRLARLQLSLRTIAPLVAEQLHESEGPDADLARESVAATAVVDGLLLLDRHPPGDLRLRRLLDQPPDNVYLDPGDWDPLTDDEWRAVTAVLSAAEDAVDAVADVMLAESVLQYAGGNPTRAAAAMDAMNGAAAPAAELDILDTQDAAERLTHRVLAVVGAGAGTAWNALRPRALVEPALEAWASTRLGPPESVVVADLTASGDGLVTLDAAGWCALDLVHVGDEVALERALRDHLPALEGHDLAVRPDAGWPAGSRSIAQAFGIAATLRALMSAGTPLLPDALARPGTTPGRSLGGARQTLEARLATGLAPLVAAVAALESAAADVPEDGIVADEQEALALADTVTPLHAFGVRPQPVADRPLDVSWVRDAYASAAAKARDARALLDRLIALPTDTSDATVLDAAQEVAEALFGDGFVVVPVVGSAADAGDDFAVAVADPALPEPAQPAVRRFVRDVATVREQVRRLSETLLVGGALGVPARLAVVQLTERTDDGPAPGTTHWLAGPLPADGPWPSGPAAHLVLDPVEIDDGSGPLSGLVVDAWVEDLPNQPGPPRDPQHVQPNEIVPGLATTGLAVRAHGASARAPQAVLSAISPDGSRWTAEALHGVVTSTLDLARLRLVRLDTMPGDAVALPALYVRSSSLQGEKTWKYSALIEASKIYSAMPFVKEVP